MSDTNYRRDIDAVHDRIKQREHDRADREQLNPDRVGVYCLCNHLDVAHDDGGQGACTECNCRHFEWDPTY